MKTKTIKITAKSRELDNDHAQWSLSLADEESATIMCDTIHRPDAQSITVIAELAAIWTACKQIRGYRWIEIHCSRETETVLKWFNYGKPPVGYEAAYRHLSGYIVRHDVMVNPDRALYAMTQRIISLAPAMRSRVRRATQLVTMGAVWRQRSGYSCWTSSHPEHPYHIKRGEGGQWECSCPDSNAPTLARNSDVQVCKHLLAAMMDYRLNAFALHVREVTPIRKAV